MNLLRLVATTLALSSAAFAQAFTGSFALATNGSPFGLECNTLGDLLFTDSSPLAAFLGRTDVSGNIAFTLNVSQDTPSPIGVAQDGNLIYLTDGSTGEIDVYNNAGVFVQSLSTGINGGSIEGITYSPATGNLYVVNAQLNQVREFSTAGVLLNAFPLNGSSPDGIAHDASDNSFWVYDSGTDSIRHYDASFTELSVADGPVARGFGMGEGLAVIGDNIYIAVPSSDEVAVFSTTNVFAEAEPYGLGCPPSNDFYEDFGPSGNDLSGTSFTITPNGLGFDVTPTGAFDSSFSFNTGLTDEAISRANPLGFIANFPGLGLINEIDFTSNGRIGVGLDGPDFSESVTEFLEEAMVAVNWDDFNPTSGGDVYFDTFPTFAMVTWDQVTEFATTNSNTFQVKLHADGRIEINYGTVVNDGLVGLSGGVLGIDTGNLDLSASLPFSAAGSGMPLTLSTTNRPIIGQNFNMTVSNMPVTRISGGTILGLAPLSLSVPIIPVGCSLQSSGELGTLPVNLGTGSTSIALPNAPGLVGVTVYAQSVIIDPAQTTIVPALYSNGLQIDIGDV